MSHILTTSAAASAPITATPSVHTVKEELQKVLAAKKDLTRRAAALGETLLNSQAVSKKLVEKVTVDIDQLIIDVKEMALSKALDSLHFFPLTHEIFDPSNNRASFEKYVTMNKVTRREEFVPLQLADILGNSIEKNKEFMDLFELDTEAFYALIDDIYPHLKVYLTEDYDSLVEHTLKQPLFEIINKRRARMDVTKITNASSSIQKIVRGALARKTFQRKRAVNTKSLASTKIQKQLRVLFSKKRLHFLQ